MVSEAFRKVAVYTQGDRDMISQPPRNHVTCQRRVITQAISTRPDRVRTNLVPGG
jgi:hypothetical protein